MTDAPDPNLYAVGEYLGRHGDARWLYDFRCPACNACGEMGVPKAQRNLRCPESCGAIFVQWHPPAIVGAEKRPWALRCINEASARMGIEFARVHGRRGMNNR